MNHLQQFLAAETFAVAGASTHPHKYGNQVFRALIASGRKAFPLNPVAQQIEGHKSYPSVLHLPLVPESMSIITPPEVTRQVVAEAIAAGVKQLWMQPGAEDLQASEAAREAGLNVIDDGSCILVLLARM